MTDISSIRSATYSHLPPKMIWVYLMKSLNPLRKINTWDSIDCNDDSPVYCQGRFTSNDYRTNGAIESTVPTDQWSVLVHSWLPTNFEPPYPVIIYGHGLNSNAQTARDVADIVTPLGFAVFRLMHFIMGNTLLQSRQCPTGTDISGHQSIRVCL